jgi:hypothetical protein
MKEYKSMVGYGSHNPIQVAWKEFKVHIHWILHEHLLIVGCGKQMRKDHFMWEEKFTVDVKK